MSLNRLARSAVLLTALASIAPNAGCNKTNQGSPDEQATQTASAPLEPGENTGCNKTNQGSPDGQAAQAASAPLEPGEKEFPECGEGMKSTHDGRYISGPFGSSAESWDCVRDRLNDQDCRAIREERRRRIKEIPSLFECVDGEVKLKARPSQLADLGDFSHAETQTKGDCSEETREARVRIGRVLDRMKCDEEGKPHEKLNWSEAEGGRIYNPCAGGSC